MATKKIKAPRLTGSQIRHLRGLGHHLTDLAMIGKEGITPNLIKAVQDNLVAHELVKIRIQDTCPLDRKEAVEALATAAIAAVVQILGKTALLYRPNPDRDAEQRITF